jgi:hypothetical protein
MSGDPIAKPQADYGIPWPVDALIGKIVAVLNKNPYEMRE